MLTEFKKLISMLYRPVFIVGAHKSGTSLLRNLLDGHPGLFAIPFETHFFQLAGYWVDNEYRRSGPEAMNHSRLQQKFINWIHKTNTVTDRMGDTFAEGLLDEATFKSALSTLDKAANDAEACEIYWRTIHQALKPGESLPAQCSLVEKSVENAEFAGDLQRFFPEARFLHIVRNPYANVVSLRKYKSRGAGYPLLYRLIRTLYNNYYFLDQNRRRLPNYQVLRYEDLASRPRETMMKVANFLDIEFRDSLLTPTIMGRDWAGNSSSGRILEGISEDRIHAWKQQIHPLEAEYVNKTFPHVVRQWQYDYYEAGGSTLRRAHGENLRRYVANRLYLLLNAYET